MASKVKKTDYRQRCADSLSILKRYTYTGVLEIDGLEDLKQECETCWDDLKVFESVDELQELKQRVEAAAEAFKKVAGMQTTSIMIMGVGVSIKHPKQVRGIQRWREYMSCCDRLCIIWES